MTRIDQRFLSDSDDCGNEDELRFTAQGAELIDSRDSKPADQEMRLVHVAGYILTTLVVIYIFAPQERIDHIAAVWGRIAGDPGQLCLDHLKTGLKDPASARLISIEQLDDHGGYKIHYIAKNSFGAFDHGEAGCAVFNGAFSESGTEVVQATIDAQKNIARMAKENAALEAQNECVSRRIELMRAGATLEEAKRRMGRPCPMD